MVLLDLWLLLVFVCFVVVVAVVVVGVVGVVGVGHQTSSFFPRLGFECVCVCLLHTQMCVHCCVLIRLVMGCNLLVTNHTSIPRPVIMRCCL